MTLSGSNTAPSVIGLERTVRPGSQGKGERASRTHGNLRDPVVSTTNPGGVPGEQLQGFHAVRMKAAKNSRTESWYRDPKAMKDREKNAGKS